MLLLMFVLWIRGIIESLPQKDNNYTQIQIVTVTNRAMITVSLLYRDLACLIENKIEQVMIHFLCRIVIRIILFLMDLKKALVLPAHPAYKLSIIKSCSTH